jgi:hypothetical protein
MFKKTLSLLTVVALFLFNWACVIHKVNIEPVTSVSDRDDIVGVTRISGEEMKYPKENPARVVMDQIVFKNVIALSDVKDFKQNANGVVYEFTTKDGHTIRNFEGKMGSEKIVLPSLYIPLSEVKSISVRRIHAGRSILAALGVVVGVAGIVLADLLSNGHWLHW